MKACLLPIFFILPYCSLAEQGTTSRVNSCFTKEQDVGGPIISKENHKDGVEKESVTKLQYLRLRQENLESLDFSFTLIQYNNHFCSGSGTAAWDERKKKYIFLHPSRCHLEFELLGREATMTEVDSNLNHDCEVLFQCGANVYINRDNNKFHLNSDLRAKDCFDPNEG